jgi:tetratricopeptide (TPR) repeat protein
MSQYNLGEMYFKLQNYIKAEEFDLEALENYTILFNQSPNAYRDYLARTLWNLMLLYGNMENWEKFDDILEQTLKNFEDLSQQAPQYQEKVDILRELKRQRSIEKAAQ